MIREIFLPRMIPMQYMVVQSMHVGGGWKSKSNLECT